MSSLYDISLFQALDNYNNLSDEDRQILLTIMSQNLNIPKLVLHYSLEMRMLYNDRQVLRTIIHITNNNIYLELSYHHTDDPDELGNRYSKQTYIAFELIYNIETNKYQIYEKSLDENYTNDNIVIIQSGIVDEGEESYISYDNIDRDWSLQYSSYNYYNSLTSSEKTRLMFKILRIILYNSIDMIDLLEDISNNINLTHNLVTLQQIILYEFKAKEDSVSISIDHVGQDYKYNSTLSTIKQI